MDRQLHPLGPIGRARMLRRPVVAPTGPHEVPHDLTPTEHQAQNEQDDDQMGESHRQHIVLNPGEHIFHPHVGLDRTNPRPPGERFLDQPEADKPAEPVVATPPHLHVNPADVYTTQSLLITRLPAELVDQTLDYAEYFLCETIGNRDTEANVGGNGSLVYLTCKVPDFEAMEPDTVGKGGRGGGRPGRVRKLVFRLRSKDQGWSSNTADKDTYRGAYSWVDVEIWRKPSPETTTAAAAEPIVPTEYENDDIPADVEVDGIDNPLQPKPNSKKGGEEAELVRIGEPHLLQRNLHAARGFTDHTIIWHWTEDPLPDEDENKWEPNCTESWHRDGHPRDAEFVKSLCGGDEIRVVLRCMYPGWACRAASCEVQVYWAV